MEDPSSNAGSEVAADLLLETPPHLPEWQVVQNRLRRAAHR